jgi:hypothetical protein
MALNYAVGWRVRVVLNDGAVHEGHVEIKCGMKDVGDWFVLLDDGTTVCVREWQIERIKPC